MKKIVADQYLPRLAKAIELLQLGSLVIHGPDFTANQLLVDALIRHYESITVTEEESGL